jgi:methylation protein EvaC
MTKKEEHPSMSSQRKCLICNEPIEPFMSFGKMPIANGFLAKEQFAKEYFFNMQVAHCPKCGMFQLADQPEREKMFNENYAFFSGTSKLMAVHFKEFAEHALKDYIDTKDPFMVEIGSNDGIMLQNFAVRKIRHLGIEPSANVAKAAIDKGINTISKFFDEQLARQIVEEYGQADAFLAANVMCHIPYIHSILEGIRILLKPNGIVMFEDPYLGDVIKNTTYDQIYDEHVFLFSVTSIKYLFEQHGMVIINVEPQQTHGGSMRYVIAHKGVRPISRNVTQQLRKERKLGLDKPETYLAFRRNCENSRDSLMSLLNSIRKQGKKIIGYAATSKSTTIINYCGITTKQIDFICDTTPIKQGKYSPGAHIPVRLYEEFLKEYPDYALLFGYNHAKEIMAKETDFMKSGGKWIVYVPEVKVLE